MVVRSLTLFASLSLLSACSSSSPTGSAGSARKPDPAKLSAFAAYCTGKLSVAKELLVADPPSGWSGDGSVTAPVGTTILVAERFGKWGGFVFLDDGTAAQVSTEFGSGLVKGTDFTSDCAPDSPTTKVVLLTKATFYATAALTGEACAFDAPTEFTSYSYSRSGSDSAQVAAPEIKAKCGFDQSYSKDILTGDLIRKP